jgi:pectate lyase
VAAAGTVVTVAAVTVPPVFGASVPSAAALTIARQTLAANDGWASATTGTTGGSAADDAHVFVVRTRPSWSPR